MHSSVALTIPIVSFAENIPKPPVLATQRIDVDTFGKWLPRVQEAQDLVLSFQDILCGRDANHQIVYCLRNSESQPKCPGCGIVFSNMRSLCDHLVAIYSEVPVSASREKCSVLPNPPIINPCDDRTVALCGEIGLAFTFIHCHVSKHPIHAIPLIYSKPSVLQCDEIPSPNESAGNPALTLLFGATQKNPSSTTIKAGVECEQSPTDPTVSVAAHSSGGENVDETIVGEIIVGTINDSVIEPNRENDVLESTHIVNTRLLVVPIPSYVNRFLLSPISTVSSDNDA